MTTTQWILSGIALSAGAILLLQDWRRTFPALLINYICLALFLSNQRFLKPDLTSGGWETSTVILVKLITGVAVTAI